MRPQHHVGRLGFCRPVAAARYGEPSAQEQLLHLVKPLRVARHDEPLHAICYIINSCLRLSIMRCGLFWLEVFEPHCLLALPAAGQQHHGAPGVSQGCHTCTSPGSRSFSPSARPVAVPWVSSRRMPGSCSRSWASKMAAARVSPSDTAWTQTNWPIGSTLWGGTMLSMGTG